MDAKISILQVSVLKCMKKLNPQRGRSAVVKPCVRGRQRVLFVTVTTTFPFQAGSMPDSSGVFFPSCPFLAFLLNIHVSCPIYSAVSSFLSPRSPLEFHSATVFVLTPFRCAHPSCHHGCNHGGPVNARQPIIQVLNLKFAARCKQATTVESNSTPPRGESIRPSRLTPVVHNVRADFVWQGAGATTGLRHASRAW